MPHFIPRVDNSFRRIKASRFFVYLNLNPMTLSKRFIIPAILLGLFLSTCVYASSEYSDIQILRSDQNGIVFKYKVPELSTSRISSGDTLFDLLSIDKCPLSRDDGYPQVPSRIVVIGIPQNSQVDVRVLDENSLDKGKFNLPFFEKKVDEINQEKARSLRKDLSNTDAFFPENRVSFDPPTFIRNQRILRLKLFPVQYNPARKAVKYFSEITVEVDFTGGEKTEGTMERDLFENVYKETILNYEGAKNWRKTREVGLKKVLQVNPFSYSNSWYKITLRDNGIYKIDGNFLANAGITLSSIDPQKIRIFSGGGKILPDSNSSPRPELRELAILVSDGGDNKFDPNDYILFYGWSVNNWEYDSTSRQYKYYLNPYTRDNVYWLTFTGNFPDSAKRMQIVNGSLTEPNPVVSSKSRDRIHMEDDFMLAEYSGDPYNYYHWYWQTGTSFTFYPSLSSVFPGDTAIITVKYFLSSPSSAYLDTFRLETISVGTYVTTKLTDGLHTLRFNFNYQTYLDYYEIEYSRKLLCSYDQLRFENPDTSGVIEYKVSGFNGTVPYLFEIEDRFGVKKIENFVRSADSIKFQDQLASGEKKQFYLLDQSRFKTPISLSSEQIANLRDVSNQADLLVITHSDFYDQLQEYKNLRESLNGITVKLVKVQDIYNEFSWGLFDPVAIRDFLKYAYENYPVPAPAYVLLAGDGNYDFKDLLRNHSPIWIPPFTPDNTVSDDNFVYFDTSGHLDEDANGRVDMFIGRWPVKTQQDAQVIVNKIREYEASPDYGTWKNLITLVADDEFGPPPTNNENEHTLYTEEIADKYIPRSFNLNKIYLVEYPFDASRWKPEAEDAVINAFNNGTAIVNYMGHGNPDLWAHERAFRRREDIPKLKNKKKYPLVYAASCSIGLFFSPNGEGMAEDLLRAEDKGAISVLSATGLVYASANAALSYKVYDLLLKSDSFSVAQALYIAKLLRSYFYYDPNDRYYNITGDPFTHLASPRLNVKVTDLSPDTLKALSRINFKGEVTDRSGNLQTNFKGSAYLLAFDSNKEKVHTMPGGGTIPYSLPGNVIFRGSALVDGGKFEGSFIVPKDMEYGGKDGRISAYVVNSDSTIDGSGALDSIAVAGTDTTVKDSLGPEVRIAFVQNPKFIDGDTVQPDPDLIVYVSDTSGINLTGELGHRITLSIDDDWENIQDLTLNFQYDLNSYSQGSLTQKVNLKEGDHTLKIKAWDNANNSTLASFQVKVIALTKELAISQVMNYPNPFSRFTQFTYELSVPAEKVEIKIFTLSGRLIRTMSGAGSAGFNSGVVWDGRDQDGDKVANGVYIYKVVARTRFNVNGEDANKEAEAIGKAVVMN
ncbi:MAG: type IX secretion system sortase PorU [candidate division Zixibacteria bacterium]|nr:type IX secretion system sortase PorU [candidate division Zixibacteria bacterium]